MVAKPQNETAARGRAGVPLARAQRLNEKATAQADRGPSTALPVAISGIALIGVLAFFTMGQSSSPSDVSVTPVGAVKATAQELPQDPTPEIAPAPLETASVAVPDVMRFASAVDAAAEAPAQSARPRLAPCIETIEVTLRRLEAVNAQGLDWEAKQLHIQDMAQAGLNCHLAIVQLDGDVELAKSDLADLRVRWDRDSAVLELTIVDSFGDDLHKVAYTDDGQPIEFIVH